MFVLEANIHNWRCPGSLWRGRGGGGRGGGQQGGHGLLHPGAQQQHLLDQATGAHLQGLGDEGGEISSLTKLF